jgi:N6-adenosine-specific RNA methylase IME4
MKAEIFVPGGLTMAKKKSETADTRHTQQAAEPVKPIDEKEIKWMTPKDIAIKDEGTCNVLVVAQHGYPGDDDNVEILAALLAKKLECFAVVNNRMYNRKAPKGSYPYTEDLNLPEEARQCEKFWGPLIDRIKHIIRFYPKPPLVLFIHGMSDDNAKSEVGEGACVAMGLGYVGEYDPKTATLSKAPFSQLKALLNKDVGLTEDGIERYAATGRVPTVLKNEAPRGYEVEAVQLEIRYTGFRDTRPNLEKAAAKLAKVIRDKKMKKFVTWEQRAEPLPKEALDPVQEGDPVKPTSAAPRVGSAVKLVPETAKPDQITIDAEFARMIHDLSPAEFKQLTENIRVDGCLDPLAVWEHDGKLILLDGHHRLKVCKEHNKPFQIVKIPLANRKEAMLWIIDKQMGRRTLCAYARIELLQPYDEIVRREARERQQQAYQKRGPEAEATDSGRIHTDEVMGRKAGVGARTYSKAREIIEHGTEDLKEKLRREELSIDAAYQLIQKPKKEKSKKKDSQLSSGASEGGAQDDAQINLKLPPPCEIIVINRAWGSSSIGISRLAELPMARMAATDCILWLWTPVKHIRNVFPVLDKWGFEFRTILAWLKSEMVKDELLYDMANFCLVASKGEPGINKDYKFGTLLKAMTEKGAQQPRGFFTMVEERCADQTRLEVFAESPRKGWLAWPPVEEKKKTEKEKPLKPTPKKDPSMAIPEKKLQGSDERKGEATESDVEPPGTTPTEEPEATQGGETSGKSS